MSKRKCGCVYTSTSDRDVRLGYSMSGSIKHECEYHEKQRLSSKVAVDASHSPFIIMPEGNDRLVQQNETMNKPKTNTLQVLEEKIMAFNVAGDLDLFIRNYDSMTEDQKVNFLIGLQEVYRLREEECINALNDMAEEFYRKKN